jgi:hypothetical protein
MFDRSLRRPSFPDALYQENWRSGGRGIVGANGCVWVSLLPGRLVTGVHFPLNLTLPRRLLRWAGLDNDLPLCDVVAIEEESFLLQRRLRIRYRTPSGETSFWLRLHRPDALREAFTIARQRV